MMCVFKELHKIHYHLFNYVKAFQTFQIIFIITFKYAHFCEAYRIDLKLNEWIMWSIFITIKLI